LTDSRLKNKSGKYEFHNRDDYVTSKNEDTGQRPMLLPGNNQKTWILGVAPQLTLNYLGEKGGAV
jgi:hypothetical protein